MTITEIILLVGWIFVLLWVPFVYMTNRKVHPQALFVLFGAEMWERFSYYGMRALLVLYMSKVLFADLGEGANVKALGVYGSYTAMVYLLPVLGGLVADKIFGFRKAIMFGGILMMFGHFALALEGMLFEGSLPLFYGSLALIIVGNGYFKPNISSFLGKFYETDDPRKDGAFSIFYMGVNIGAFLSTLTCGYVGEQISWHYGFGLAGIGMGLGLIMFYLMGPSTFGDEGLEPKAEDGAIKQIFNMPSGTMVYVLSLIGIPVVAAMLNADAFLSSFFLVVSVLIIGYLVWDAVKLMNSGDRAGGQRLLVVVVLFFFHAIFWALFEQAGGSLTLFTDTNVNRNAFGSEIPASIFQSLNPFYIMILAPVFSWLWITLRKKGWEPSTPMKFVLGLAQLGLGFLVIVWGARYMGDSEGMVPVFLLFVMYLLHTTGELSLSPVGLSMITKLSPAKTVGFVMGAWFLSIALANKIAGWIGQLTGSGSHGAEATEAVLTGADALAKYGDTYMFWGVYVVLGAALLLLLLVPMLRKWMHGIH